MTLVLPRGGVGVQLSSKRSEICDWLLPRLCVSQSDQLHLVCILYTYTFYLRG